MVSILKFTKILVTGGAGFIGSALIKKLVEHGVEVHVLDDLSTGLLSNLPNSNTYVFHHGSVLDTSFLKRFKDIEFDLAINLASVVGMRLATKYRMLTYRICTVGTQNLISVLGNTPILFFSSSSVYGTYHSKPVSESCPIIRENLVDFDGGKQGYACGKWDMERIAQQEAEKGRNVMIVRPFNIIGPYQLSEYGMVVPTLLKQAIAGKPLTVYGDGSQVRSFSCIDTFIDCLFQLMHNRQLWNHNHNVINIGSDSGTSISNLANTIKDITNSDSEIEYIPYSKTFGSLSDVQYRVPNSSYAKSNCVDLNWPNLNSLIHKIHQHYINKI